MISLSQSDNYKYSISADIECQKGKEFSVDIINGSDISSLEILYDLFSKDKENMLRQLEISLLDEQPFDPGMYLVSKLSLINNNANSGLKSNINKYKFYWNCKNILPIIETKNKETQTEYKDYQLELIENLKKNNYNQDYLLDNFCDIYPHG